MAQIGLDAREDLSARVERGAKHGDLHLVIQMTEDHRTDTVRIFLGFGREDAARITAALEKAAAGSRDIRDTWA